MPLPVSAASVCPGETTAVSALGKYGMHPIRLISYINNRKLHAIWYFLCICVRAQMCSYMYIAIHDIDLALWCSEEVISPRQPMALRLSANLMIGILRVYRQQTHYIYGTVKQHSSWN